MIIIEILIYIALFLAASFLASLLSFNINLAITKIVTNLFYFGMSLKRKYEKNELNKIEKLLSLVYVYFIFLPADFLLNFKVASEQMIVRPKFELTTSLISRHLSDKPNNTRDYDNKKFVIAMRKFLDDNKKSTFHGLRACVALGYFDIIDDERGDLEHFKNANDYRSKFDEDLVI